MDQLTAMQYETLSNDILSLIKVILYLDWNIRKRVTWLEFFIKLH